MTSDHAHSSGPEPVEDPKEVATGMTFAPATRAASGKVSIDPGIITRLEDVELQWQKYARSKYAWSKYGWRKYVWSVVIDGR